MSQHYGSLCAEFYDLTKPVGGTYPDVPYYRRHLTAIGGRALEAAVGTGRLLVPLLQSGLQVDGIDSSDEMLTYCRHNCSAAGLWPTLHRGELQTMELPDRYSAIVITFGSFMLLARPDEAIAALHHIRRHLVPGGRLFVDVDAPRAHMERGESRRVADCRDGCTIVLVDAPIPTDAGDAVVRRSLSYEKWSDVRLIASEAQALHLRRYDEHEMTAVLAGAGFVDIGACADYVEGRPTANADQWLCFSAAIPAP